jgi:hypothetical protein
MLPGTKTVDTAAREPEIMRTICDPYLERFDAEYVERYLRDRDTALRPSRATGNAGLSAARFATAIGRRTRRVAADLRDRIR